MTAEYAHPASATDPDVQRWRAEATQLAESLASVQTEADRCRRGWRRAEETRHQLQRTLDQAREQAAELLRETAQLHRQLDSLGASPDALARAVGAGEAVGLFGPVTSELLEAQGGVFVPIPKGHMLSVTVTPYDSTPLPDDTADGMGHDSTCRH